MSNARTLSAAAHKSDCRVEKTLQNEISDTLQTNSLYIGHFVLHHNTNVEPKLRTLAREIELEGKTDKKINLIRDISTPMMR